MKGTHNVINEHDDIMKHAADAVERWLSRLVANNAETVEWSSCEDSSDKSANDGDDDGDSKADNAFYRFFDFLLVVIGDYAGGDGVKVLIGTLKAHDRIEALTLRATLR